MINVLFCGISDYLDEIIDQLDDCNVVVGYTDIKSCLNTFSQFDGLPYGKITDFDSSDYDVIIVTYKNEENILKAIDELNDYREKILIYNLFRDSTICDFFDKFDKTNLNCSNIILGMSHAQNDIQTHLLNENSFKFSYPSMDIFCHYKILEHICNLAENKLYTLKKIIIEVPYYIFNYDLSMSQRSVLKRLYYFKLFDDYHNYGLNKDEQLKIHQFNLYLKVINRRKVFTKNNQIDYNTNLLHRFATDFYHQKDVFLENSKVWSSYREKTIKENIMLFDKIINLLYSRIPNIKIIILICPFNPIYRLLHYNDIKKMRSLFYSKVDKYNLSVVDFFEWSNNPFYFLDHCHLNTRASYIFTNTLKNILELNHNKSETCQMANSL